MSHFSSRLMPQNIYGRPYEQQSFQVNIHGKKKYNWILSRLWLSRGYDQREKESPHCC